MSAMFDSIRENLRDRLQNVQQDLVSLSLRDLTSSFNPSTSSNSENNDSSTKLNTQKIYFHYSDLIDQEFDPCAGADLIEYFQQKWKEIQKQTNHNCDISKKILQDLDCLNQDLTKQFKIFDNFNTEIQNLNPEIDSCLNNVEIELKQSSNLLKKLEDAISELECEKIKQKFKDRKLESQQKLDKMLARRAEDLALYESQLFNKIERLENEILIERQQVFQQAFEEELKLYKQGTLNKIKIDEAIKQETKLEDISLEIDKEEVDEFEKFLSSTQN